MYLFPPRSSDYASRFRKNAQAHSVCAPITPGFIDAHTHPEGVEELTGVNVDLRRIEEIKAALKKKAATTPLGYWVEGYKYDDTKLEEGRPVLRKDLDEAVPDHPAMVGHRGGHTGVFNSKAFELAGITAQTPDPKGGKFCRESGELTGKVAEQAMGPIRNHSSPKPVLIPALSRRFTKS